MSTKAKPKRKPVWRAVTAANAPFPGVNPANAEYGKRTVLRVFAIDSLGRLFTIDPDGEVVMLGTPPGVNGDGG